MSKSQGFLVEKIKLILSPMRSKMLWMVWGIIWLCAMVACVSITNNHNYLNGTPDKAVADAAINTIGGGIANDSESTNSTSKFAPIDGRILVLAGQTLEATDAYYGSDIIPRPAGFTDYISYDVGTEFHPKALDAPRVYKGNDGLLESANWGAGSQCVDCNLGKSKFQNAMVAIGMYLAGPKLASGSMCSATAECNTAKIFNGKYDQQLATLANWFKAQKNRPVFLRIGYEFDGVWNGYDAAQYVAAYKYIVQFLDKANVQNVAYIWQTSGYATAEQLRDFYPEPDTYRDRYVDWVGYSYFSRFPERVGINELAFAREHGLNAFASEVAPHTSDCLNQIDMAKNTDLALQWIDGFFEHIEINRDVIRGISYINARWNDRRLAPQWLEQNDHHCGGFFSKSNSRLQDNPEIESYWAEQIKAAHYMNDAPENWELLIPETFIETHSTAKR